MGTSFIVDLTRALRVLGELGLIYLWLPRSTANCIGRPPGLPDMAVSPEGQWEADTNLPGLRATYTW